MITFCKVCRKRIYMPRVNVAGTIKIKCPDGHPNEVKGKSQEDMKDTKENNLKGLEPKKKTTKGD